MQSQIIQFVRENHPEFEIRDFTQENIATGPLVLLGSLAGIDNEGKVCAAVRKSIEFGWYWRISSRGR